MSRKTLGLDIRDDSIYAVLVKSSIKGNWIESHLHIPIPEQIPVPPPFDEDTQEGESNETDKDTAIGEALKVITEKMDITGAACILSFSADQVSYRNIRLPFKDQKKIRQILSFEIEPTLPFFIDNVILDFHAISDLIRVSDAKNYTDIIVTAVEKDTIQTYLGNLTVFKMDPETMTISGYPTALCLAKFASIPENCLFLDIDKHKCTAFIIISGQICLIRPFPINSNTVWTESICSDIEHTLGAFEEVFHIEFQPDEIYVTGYGLDSHSSSGGFEQEVERTLNIPVKRTNLVRENNALMKAEPATALKTSAQLDNAFALALSDIEGMNDLNFRKGPFASKRHWEEHKSSFILTGILFALVLISLFLNMVMDTYSLKRQVAGLDKQIIDIFKSAFPDIKVIVDPVQQMRMAIKEKKDTFSPQETETTFKSVDILNEISRGISKDIDVEFKRFVLGSDNILIAGDTDTYNAVDDIKNQLESSDLFREVIILSSTIEKKTNRIRFKLKVQFQDKD